MNNKENELKDNGHADKEQNQQNIDDAAINFNSDDSLAGTTHLNDELASEEDDRIQKLTEELKEANDKYLRLAAEFDNYRKRNAKERNELIKSAGEDVIKSLLDILDDSERAAQQLELSDDIKTNKEGVFLVFNKLKNVLQGRGLKAMESKEQEFNPELHEAITEIPAPTEALQGKVLDEVQKGYFLNDKIIRHAKVVVGK
ncbi:nucleotide exchange factor GrpE [Taibaiella chishuiensis]|uniref:Protein GrpE n=1 Tax=Taibaiella chishuiensis TaxID=1434707 RepID=A0A2P8D4R8_9BACT|nr:nucleotide exchange factor GrpE [Taibaiella chishuiensis]PSK92207.1 molecular chaperone GrpE [Taibaiella chishuiensis]